MLTRLLDSHPEIRCTGELLRKWVPWPALYVESERRRYSEPVFGFKVFVHHLIDDQRVSDPKSLLALFHRSGYRIIYLKRENLLRHAISQYLRKVTGVTHSRSGNVVRGPYEVDIAFVLRHLRTRERFWREAEAALGDLPYLKLSYEQDLEDGSLHQATANRAFSFLGLDSAPVEAELKRINDKRLPELIANYDDLVAALEGTPYSVWLEEPVGATA